MAAYSIVRIKKLKSWGAVAGSVAHNARQRATPNADPAALHHNQFLIGSPDDDPVKICQAKLGNQKIRKNAVYGIDGFLGASPEYFRPENPDKYGEADPVRLNAWAQASVKWLQDKYGDRIINAVLHLDEATPHIQFLLLPLDDTGKLNCRALFGGKKYVLSQLQSDYAEAMAPLGLERGREGSKATHMEVAEYYAATQKVERINLPPLASVADIQPPEPPGPMARLKTENLLLYAQEAVADQMTKLEPMLSELANQNSFLLAENARLKLEQEQLKDSNSHLSRENSDFKAIANSMRELDLGQVLTQMFGARESPNSHPKNKTRTLTLPDGISIEYSGNQWREVKNGIKGKGAINLVMHLSGYGQDKYQTAVREMVEVFGEEKSIVNTLAAHLASKASGELRQIAKQKFTMPEPCECTWPEVSKFLISEMKLPPEFIAELHKQKLLFSDTHGNCVFAGDNDSGVFKIGLGEKPFSQTVGKDIQPFVLAGTDDKIMVTDSPLEALSIKLLYPERTVLATGGLMLPTKLEPYINNKEMLLSFSSEKKGQQMAVFLSEHFPKAKRIRPIDGLSWQECRMQYMEKQETEAKFAADKQIQMQQFRPTQIVERSSGMGR